MASNSTTTRSFVSRNPFAKRSSSTTPISTATGTNTKKKYDGSFDCAQVRKTKLVISQLQKKTSRGSWRMPRAAREKAMASAGIHGSEPPIRMPK